MYDLGILYLYLHFFGNLHLAWNIVHWTVISQAYGDFTNEHGILQQVMMPDQQKSGWYPAMGKTYQIAKGYNQPDCHAMGIDIRI